MEPIQRQPVGVSGWNDRAALALLVVVARHLFAVEPAPLTADRLARVVATHDLPSLVAALAESPDPQARHAAYQLRRALQAGQAGVYVCVLPGIPVALGDPFFRLALAKAAYRAGLDLFPPTSPRA